MHFLVDWRGAVAIGAGDRLWSEMTRSEVLLGTLPAATMFERTDIGPASTSPSVASDLSLTCVGWCPIGAPTKTEIENYTIIFAKHLLMLITKMEKEILVKLDVIILLKVE